MTCYDWSVVGFSSHPIPGDPSDVSVTARMFGRTADNLETASAGLKSMGRGGQTSEAIDKAVDNAHELASQLELACDRYRVAGGALSTYAGVLERAQRQAEEALQSASTAAAEGQQARQRANDLWWGAKTTFDDHERGEFLRYYHESTAAAESAESNLAAARARIQDAINDRDTAAEKAKGSINHVIAGRDLNDSITDKIGQFWKDSKGFLREVFDVLDIIGTILTAIGLVLLVTPAAPIGGAFLGAAQLVGKVGLIGHILLDIDEGVETGDWSALRDTGASAVVSVLLGRVIGKRITKGVFRGLAKSSQQRTGGYGGVTKALTGKEPLPPTHPAWNARRVLKRSNDHLRIDSVISTFKGQAYGTRARSLVLIQNFNEADGFSPMIGEVAGRLVEGAKTLGEKAAEGSLPRMYITNPSPMPAGALVR